LPQQTNRIIIFYGTDFFVNQECGQGQVVVRPLLLRPPLRM
jgi:hypothetical protein